MDNKYSKYMKGIIEALEFSNGLLDASEVIRDLESGAAYLKDYGKGFAVFDVIKNNVGLLIRIKIIAGTDMQEWLDQVDSDAMEFAKAHKAVGIVAVGRRGWNKECYKRGYKHTHSLFYKEMNHA